MTEDDPFTRRLNATGFLLQLALEEEIRARAIATGTGAFSVPFDSCEREVPWRDPVTGDEGYLDLVIRRRGVFFLFECKRTKPEHDWLFLVRKRDHAQASGTVLCNQPRHASPSWVHAKIEPAAPVSEFVSIHGEGGDRPKNGRMLERDAGQLVKALRGFASEEFERPTTEDPPAFVPVIVTTARLKIRLYEAEELSVADGTLPPGEFVEVPWVMFKKPLTVHTWPTGLKGNRSELRFHREPTIFVATAASVADLFMGLHVGTELVKHTPQSTAVSR